MKLKPKPSRLHISTLPFVNEGGDSPRRARASSFSSPSPTKKSFGETAADETTRTTSRYFPNAARAPAAEQQQPQPEQHLRRRATEGSLRVHAVTTAATIAYGKTGFVIDRDLDQQIAMALQQQQLAEQAGSAVAPTPDEVPQPQMRVASSEEQAQEELADQRTLLKKRNSRRRVGSSFTSNKSSDDKLLTRSRSAQQLLLAAQARQSSPASSPTSTPSTEGSPSIPHLQQSSVAFPTSAIVDSDDDDSGSVFSDSSFGSFLSEDFVVPLLPGVSPERVEAHRLYNIILRHLEEQVANVSTNSPLQFAALH